VYQEIVPLPAYTAQGRSFLLEVVANSVIVRHYLESFGHYTTYQRMQDTGGLMAHRPLEQSAASPRAADAVLQF
jgi:hypothetical protein